MEFAGGLLRGRHIDRLYVFFAMLYFSSGFFLQVLQLDMVISFHMS